MSSEHNLRVIIIVELLFKESAQVFNGHSIVTDGQSLFPPEEQIKHENRRKNEDYTFQRIQVWPRPSYLLVS